MNACFVLLLGFESIVDGEVVVAVVVAAVVVVVIDVGGGNVSK